MNWWVFVKCEPKSSQLKEPNTSVCVHWIYLIHEFHNLSWITEINELFHDILIYWDAPVCIYFFFFQKEQYLLFNISEGYTTFLFYFSWHNVLSGVISLILISIPLINGSYIYIYHDLQYVYIYTLGRCFYPKWLTLYSSSYKYYQLIYKLVYFVHK